jgi:hypothetical protein
MAARASVRAIVSSDVLVRPRAIVQPPESPVAPLEGAVHLPLESHTFGEAQSEIEWQVKTHEPPAHAYGVQSVLFPIGSATVWLFDESQLAVAFGKHCPALHAKPAAQSVLVVHAVLHLFPSHPAMFAGHAFGEPATHAP